MALSFPWRRQWHPAPVLLPGKSHGRMSLVGCGPWGRLESDTTERLHFHFSLSCIGEGNGSPRQCSCLENPRDGGAWWAAVYGVTRSRTRLKRLSSSSSSFPRGPALVSIQDYWKNRSFDYMDLCWQSNFIRIVVHWDSSSSIFKYLWRYIHLLLWWTREVYTHS